MTLSCDVLDLGYEIDLEHQRVLKGAARPRRKYSGQKKHLTLQENLKAFAVSGLKSEDSLHLKRDRLRASSCQARRKQIRKYQRISKRLLPFLYFAQRLASLRAILAHLDSRPDAEEICRGLYPPYRRGEHSHEPLLNLRADLDDWVNKRRWGSPYRK